MKKIWILVVIGLLIISSVAITGKPPKDPPGQGKDKPDKPGKPPKDPEPDPEPDPDPPVVTVRWYILTFNGEVLIAEQNMAPELIVTWYKKTFGGSLNIQQLFNETVTWYKIPFGVKVYVLSDGSWSDWSDWWGIFNILTDQPMVGE